MKTPWDLPPRMRNKVAVAESGCWLWTGARTVGYGRIKHNDRLDLAHRVSYETLVGPIPDGLTIDHLCLVPRCINPEHLEPVTREENARRAAALIVLGPEYPCGHPRTPDNTHIIRRLRRRDGAECYTCRLARKRAWNAQRKAAA